MDNHFLKHFESELLLETVIGGVGLFIFGSRINYLRVPSTGKLTLDAAKEIQSTIIDFYNEHGGTCSNIIEYELGADVDPNVREWLAARSNEFSSISDAVVIDGMALKIIANFYMRVNRPKKLTELFSNLENSISWSLEQLAKKKRD